MDKNILTADEIEAVSGGGYTAKISGAGFAGGFSIGSFDFAVAYDADGNNLAIAVDFGPGDANACAGVC